MSAAASGRSRLRDTAAGYGWISIALHWITGVAVLVLLFVGSSIASAEDRDGMVLLHTSIALSSYAFLWARIVWRVRTGHPGPLPNQRRSFFLVGGVYKHAAFDQDGTFGKMLVAAKPGEQAPAAKPAIDRAAADLGGQ